MRISSFVGLEQFLLRHIPKRQALTPPEHLGIKRTRAFLRLLNNPEEKIRIIHIAGTSGKGSTAYLISRLLRAHGRKVGLSVSPHFLDVRERCQINNQLLSKKKFLSYLNEIAPAIKKIQKSKYGAPTYFELFVVLAFYIFWKEKTDYIVMETGLGGVFDATNVVHSKNKLCVITRIGKDHTKILGRTLGEIALKKIGIIQKNNHTIALWQHRSVNEIIQHATPAEFIRRGRDFCVQSISENETIFNFGSLPNIHVGLKGAFQAENGSLALASFLYLVHRDSIKVSERKIRGAFKRANFPGRLEIFHYKKKRIIVDGAHNPQKISALIHTLTQLYPKQKFDFLMAHKSRKDYRAMLKKILPIAERCVLTSLSLPERNQSYFHERKQKIKNVFSSADYRKFIFISNPEVALHVALASKRDVVITGSLYFVADIYPKIKDRRLS